MSHDDRAINTEDDDGWINAAHSRRRLHEDVCARAQVGVVVEDEGEEGTQKK